MSVPTIQLSATNADNAGFFKRYRPAFARSMTLARAVNLLLAGTAYGMKSVHHPGYPIMLKVETSALCNLSCPGCMQGHNKKHFKSDMRISLERFKILADETANKIPLFLLYHRGEPFLNANMLDILSILSSRGTSSSISSNFCLPFKQDFFKDLVKSGLTHVVMSVDGATKDIYDKYRIGGNFDLVTNNIKELSQAKKELKSATPIIELQFIVFDHNKDQSESILAYAQRIGVDRVSFVRDMVCNQGQYLGGARSTTHKEIVRKPYLPLCDWPWFSGLVKWNGHFLPCCDYDWTKEEHEFGVIGEKTFLEIWRGARMNALRASLRNGPGPVRLTPYCAGCSALRVRKQKPF